MPLVYRSQKRFGPVVLNFTENGYSSWGLRIGRWSWNSRTRSHRWNLPGPLSWRSRNR